MEEKWASIPGFPNYEISNFGNIARVGRTKRTPVKVSFDEDYIYASLMTPSHKSKQINLRRVLDECFDEHIYKVDPQLDLVGEVWRDVVGWEDCYEVSNCGRIRTKERIRKGKNETEAIVSAKIKEAYVDEDGYARVSLYKDGSTKLLGVHRVVAQAFVPNPNGYPQVNHLNGVKTDNRPENLEWVTNTQNIRHSISTGLRDPHVHGHCVKRLADGKVFESIAELHREIGGNYNEIVHLFKTSDGQPIPIYGKYYQIVDSEREK